MSEFDVDMLISRIVDGVATPQDMAVFDAAAAKDAGLWRELAQAQRLDRSLALAAAAEVSIADRVALPIGAAHAAQANAIETGLRRRTMWVSSWGGWAVAAALTLAFVSLRPGQQVASTPGMPAIQTAAEAFDLYQRLKGEDKPGTLVRELPDKVLLNSVKSPDGKGYDITYLRQIVEKVHVDALYHEAQDESGRRVQQPVDLTSPTQNAQGVRTPL